VDPVTLIATALAAGPDSAVRDDVRAAYLTLRDLAEKRVAGDPAGEMVLARHAASPQTWEAPLVATLSEAGARDDTALVSAAKVLMRLLDQAATGSGKYGATGRGQYNVTVQGRGTQFGSGGMGSNAFAP
jgi:hypothetical protein